MSGGSYNYLCHAEAETLVNYTVELQEMADRLAGLGYADDAARETQELLLTIRQCQNRIKSIADRMSGVWRAVEWWDSCDTSEDSVKSALEKYRS